MDFSLSDEQLMVRDSARDIAREQLAPIAEEADHSGLLPGGILESLAELGYLGMCVPAALGGPELDTVSLVLSIEEISSGCASTGALLVVSNLLVCEALIAGGTDEQKRMYLEQLACGSLRGALFVSEPIVGTDLGSLTTTATEIDSGFELSGQKNPVPGADVADLLLVAAVVNNGADQLAPGLFLVERETPGVTIGERTALLGQRACAAAGLKLGAVKLTTDAALGGNDPESLLLHLLDCCNLGLSAQAVGIAGAATAEAVRYSTERKQFGRPICSFEAIRGMLADSGTEVEAARHLVLKAASLKDAGAQFGLAAAQARLFAGEMSNRVANRAVQVHGGYGYTKDYPVERHFRDARLIELWGGTTETQRLRISEEMLKKIQGEGA